MIKAFMMWLLFKTSFTNQWTDKDLMEAFEAGYKAGYFAKFGKKGGRK